MREKETERKKKRGEREKAEGVGGYTMYVRDVPPRWLLASRLFLLRAMGGEYQ